jgi:uncharacterized membrane protein YecN with MAPEG domain
MVITVTPIYAGIAALLFVVLSVRVILMRRNARVGLGDGGDQLLLRRLRVHGNFAEYTPLVIVLMTLAELQGRPASSLHVVGLSLLAGRLLHAYGVSSEPEKPALRVAGMAFTFTALIVGALLNVLGSSSLL